MSNRIITFSISSLILLVTVCGNSQELPIFTEQLQKGVYETFEEFKFNRPSLTDSLYFEMVARKTENWDETFSVTARYADNNKKVKKVWGFCDGVKAYCFHEFEFFEIDLSNYKISFFGYGQLNENSGTTGAILGGAVGYSIEQAAAVAKIKKEKVKYHINQANGEIKKLSDVAYDAKSEQPDVYIVFYRYGKKEIPGEIQLIVNDSINIQLENYAYDQIKLKVGPDPVKIEYEKGDTTIYVDIINEDNKYVEVSNSKSDKKEKLVHWDYVTGDFYAKKAKKRQLERKED